MTVRARLAAVACAAAAFALTGCGGEPLTAGTAPLADGTTVSSRQYLADVDATAAAIRGFDDHLRQIDLTTAPRPADLGEMRDAVTGMRTAAAVARVHVERLDAQRLADSRLERQRRGADDGAAARRRAVVVGMDRLVVELDALIDRVERASRLPTRAVTAPEATPDPVAPVDTRPAATALRAFADAVRDLGGVDGSPQEG